MEVSQKSKIRTTLRLINCTTRYVCFVLQKVVKLFFRMTGSFYISISDLQMTQFLHKPFSIWCCHFVLLYCFSFSYSGKCIMRSHCGFNLHSLMVNHGEHLLMCVCIICNHILFGEMSVHMFFFSYLLIGLLFFYC